MSLSLAWLNLAEPALSEPVGHLSIIQLQELRENNVDFMSWAGFSMPTGGLLLVLMGSLQPQSCVTHTGHSSTPGLSRAADSACAAPLEPMAQHWRVSTTLQHSLLFSHPVLPNPCEWHWLTDLSQELIVLSQLSTPQQPPGATVNILLLMCSFLWGSKGNTILSNIPTEHSSVIPISSNQFICSTGQAHFVKWPWTD